MLQPGEIDSSRALLTRCWDDGEAALIRQLLWSYGIPCQMVSDLSHSVWPITIGRLGEIRILVTESDHDDALQLLAEHRRHAFRLLPGGVRSDPRP